MIKAISKVVRNGQITIPANIRKALRMNDGDFVRLDLDGNHLVITPVSVIDKSQAYFFTPEWQADELMAHDDIKKGNVTKTKNIKQLLKKLDA